MMAPEHLFHMPDGNFFFDIAEDVAVSVKYT